MEDEILEFIRKRFNSNDCNWTNGNCYYFCVILKDRFPNLNIVYDYIDGHFYCESDEYLYDYRGHHSKIRKTIPLQYIRENDSMWYDRIIRDCVL